ncbi:MAG TPA: hypothetical protein VL053_00145 [Arachidicoccus sp.]|nr:hypothetical protein [Arachidicoccus sp.]
MKSTFFKKISLITFMLIGVIFFMTSCSKDDVNRAGNKALLTAGKWELISATRTVDGQAGVTIDAPAIISFTSANHYRVYDDQGSVTHDVPFTFDDKNTISFDGITYDLTTINSSNLTLVYTHADNVTVDTFNYKRKL